MLLVLLVQPLPLMWGQALRQLAVFGHLGFPVLPQWLVKDVPAADNAHPCCHEEVQRLQATAEDAPQRHLGCAA